MTSGEIILPARGRFALRTTVLSYGYYQLPPYQWEDGDPPRLRRAEQLANGKVYLLEATPADGGVRLRVTGPGADDLAVLAPMGVRMRAALRLDEDFAPFHRLCRRDPWLRPVARLGLGRMLRGTSLFEDVAKAIGWTNTSWPAAVTMIGRLGALGDPCPAAPALRAFPTPARLAALDERQLRAVTRLGYRVPYLRTLAAETANGVRDLDELERNAARYSSAELGRTLRTIRGIGPGSVPWLLMMLGHYDVPVIDRATLRYAADAFYRGRRPTERQVAGRVARYGEWRALALWFSQCLATGHTAVAR